MTDDRNISTEHQREADKNSLDLDRASDRGERAFIAENGEARGSGSGAGGGNPGEDYDDDASGGGGALTADDRQAVKLNRG